MQERYERGLERIKATQDAVEALQEQMESKTPELVEKQIEIERLIEGFKQEHTRVERRRDVLVEEEKRLLAEGEEANKIKEECERALESAIPMLYEAIQGL